jgi:uncharacterized YigZ family protein
LEYITLKKRGSAEFTEKKSRFIGTGAPVKSEEEALEFVSEIRKKYPDATHNVYAYILRKNNTERFSDDSEPGGTAGVPCLETLKKNGLKDCAVVATRYFGGVLLGAGGLVRAYSKTASAAVEACGKSVMTSCVCLKTTISYDFVNSFERLSDRYRARIYDTRYEENVSFSLYIKETDVEKFSSELFDISNGRFKAEQAGKIFAEV